MCWAKSHVSTMTDDGNFNTSELPSVEDIIERVNARYDSLFHIDDTGKRHILVCSICDIFLKNRQDNQQISVFHMERAQKILSWESFPDDRRKDAHEAYFSANPSIARKYPFVKGLALSPRTHVYRKEGRGNKSWGFSCCKRCKGNLQKKEPTLPRHAILNSNYVGVTPSCITDLNEVEYAFLTPTRHMGYCFTYSGGKTQNLKGTLSFMRVEPRRIATAVATLDSMGLNENVLVLLTGKLTKAQKKRAQEKCKIRPWKMKTALLWLVENNHKWKNVNYEAILRDLENRTPVVFDRSSEVASENRNVEEQEIWTCYYPDGSMNPRNGGFSDNKDFKDYVAQMASEGYDVEVQANLNQEFIRDGEADVLVDACLYQFPYGIGGMYDRRLVKGGKSVFNSDIPEFMERLSLISQPGFQRPLLQLIMYSLISKSRILKTSRFQLKGKADAKSLAEGLSIKDVRSCIDGRRRGNRNQGTGISRKFLDAVDATARALPHTNEAARASAGIGEAMQHHFGMSSYFVTATFDDENSLLMQVAANNMIDDETPVENLTDFELTQRAKERRALRLEFPGLAAINFEILFEILMEEVIGWDMAENKPMDRAGFFGFVEALIAAMEEQGRFTLHTHMTIYVRKYKQLQKDLFFGDPATQRRAENVFGKICDHVSTTELFPTTHRDMITAFDHHCSVPKRCRTVPQVVDNQSLRNLRNIYGYNDCEGVFAKCQHCPQTWTYEDLVGDYVKNTLQMVNPAVMNSSAGDADLICPEVSGPRANSLAKGKHGRSAVPRARLFGKVIEYQKGIIPPPKGMINAVYQHHVSCHVSGCFRCKKAGSKKRGHVCGPQCECRYRMPAMKRRRSEIHVDKKKINWFLWDGNKREQPLCHIIPKRKDHDLFQNVCCPAISYSKLSCNSNVSLVMDGPIGQYQHKYQQKPNQKEETANYAEVEDEVKKFAGERKHADDRPEALRRICRAAFAHNKRNIISPCFASYLTRNDSRFFYSHQFVFCPLKDLIRLHHDERIRGILKYTPSGESFFENVALDYLCRHEELEPLSIADFVEGFTSTYISLKTEEEEDVEIYPFKPESNVYRHPSVFKRGPRKGRCSRGSVPREDDVYFRVSQWMFPDTASFKDNIITCHPQKFCRAMEVYAEVVLTLFLPHRRAADLHMPDEQPFKYVRKFRQVYTSEITTRSLQVFTERNIAFLQNLQDCRSNSLRFKSIGDPLEEVTMAYQSPNSDKDDWNIEEEDEDEEETSYEEFLSLIEQRYDSTDDTTDHLPEHLPRKLQEFNFKYARGKGSDQVGYKLDIPVIRVDENTEAIVQHTYVPTEGATDDRFAINPDDRPLYTCEDIVKVHLKRGQPKMKTTVFDEHEIEVQPATGSVRNIREWAKAAFASDPQQRRAFEVLTSAFLLTFYEESPENAIDAAQEEDRWRTKYRQMQKRLRKLRGCDRAHNLICLLHGPGGSGKTSVINTVQEYARSYCQQLRHPFTKRTIVITAMSGVAATLINGETTHSVLGLNRDTIQEEEIEAWKDARLLIIDECSFASERDYMKMNDHLVDLMQGNGGHKGIFGGINIVFSGDFSQLEPVGRDPIYAGDNDSAYFHRALNVYIELNGKWRFMKDPHWGDIMARMRIGEPTLEDINLINEKCIDYSKEIPAGTQIASWTNADRDAINSALFDDYAKINRPADGSTLLSACVVFMDELYMNDSSKTPVPVTSNVVKRYFYENCTENECSSGKNGRQGRVDPCLKLYYNSPMMLTQNTDVTNGEANGSRVILKSIIMKQGEDAFVLQLDNGTAIQACFASQVRYLVLEHENEDITPRRFHLESDVFSFGTRLCLGLDIDCVKMKGRQFPLVSNSCTTGHKLQGCTVLSILVNDWYYGANWAYVVLSRVKTMMGLIMRKPLSTDLKKYAKPKAMRDMIQRFADTIAVPMLSDEEYAAIDDEHDHAMPMMWGRDESIGVQDMF